MRVGLDLTFAVAPNPSGTSLYARALTEALGNLPNIERVACLRLSAWRRSKARGAMLDGLPVRWYWDRYAPGLARELDVFHGLESRPARFSPKRLVVTLHDVMHLALPEFRHEPGAERRRAHYAVIRERADLVLTPSETERARIIEHLGVPPNRVRAVPLAPSPSFTPCTQRPAGRPAGLERPYVLFVGVAQPRKNVALVARALAAIPEGPTLAMAGSIHPAYRQELEVDLARLGDRVIRLGYVENIRLPALYAGAEAVVIASLYESFGIPMVEAMACGCPVIAADAGALPEVAGGAARLFDPRSLEQLIHTLREVTGSAEVQDGLRRQGFARASEFSYERTARETAAAYTSLR